MKSKPVPKLSWVRAWDFIMQAPNLTPAEKIYCLEFYRYLPNAYVGTASDIKSNTGLPIDTIDTCRQSLDSDPAKLHDMAMSLEPGQHFFTAYDVILHNRFIHPGEKLVLLEVCRYWPYPYPDTNETISNHTGISIREIQRCLKSLSTGQATRVKQGKSARRAYIIRGYDHIRGLLHPQTVRCIAPTCLPGRHKRPDMLPSEPQKSSRRGGGEYVTGG